MANGSARSVLWGWFIAVGAAACGDQGGGAAQPDAGPDDASVPDAMSPADSATGVCPQPRYTFYVDPAGSDSALGTSPATAWATLDKVNAAAAGQKPCTAIYFKRGGTWRSYTSAKKLLVVSNGSAADGPVTYGAYGSGPKPVLLGSVRLPAKWQGNQQGHSSNLWRLPTGDTTDVGNLYFLDGNGALEGNGWKKFPTDATPANLDPLLTQPGDFWSDPATGDLWLDSPVDPALAYPSIEAAMDKEVIAPNQNHDIVFENLDIHFAGSNAINATACERLTFQDLDLSYIGGALWGGHPGQRLGNAIQLWSYGKDYLVARNRIWEIYDTAVTNQADGSSTAMMSNIVYQNNVIWNVPYAGVELMDRGKTTSAMDHVRFVHNTVAYSGAGWSAAQRIDIKGPAVFLETVVNPPAAVEVSNNVFYGGNTGLLDQSSASWNASTVTLQHNCYWQTTPSSTTDLSSPSRWRSAGLNVWSVGFATGPVALTLNGVPCDSAGITKATDLTKPKQCFLDLAKTQGTLFLYSSTNPGFNAAYLPISATYAHELVILADKGVFDPASFATYQSLLGLDTASVVADPKLKSATSPFDFHLAAASPCSSGGAFLGVATDFDGKARPTSGSVGPAMGAFEP